VTNGGSVYLATRDNITGTFDATDGWRKVADSTVAGIPAVVGDVVSTGRWHNSISVAGFLVDDESEIQYSRIRD